MKIYRRSLAAVAADVLRGVASVIYVAGDIVAAGSATTAKWSRS